MSKTTTKHGVFQFHMQKKYLDLWQKYLILIKKDSTFHVKKEDRKSGNPGRISYSIMTLIYGYVMDQEPNFKLKVELEKETSTD